MNKTLLQGLWSWLKAMSDWSDPRGDAILDLEERVIALETKMKVMLAESGCHFDATPPIDEHSA